jgi:hypothetical protein
MRKVLGATLLAVALAVGLAGAPAHAGRSTTVTDNPNDARAGIDMRLVTINKVQGALRVRTAFSHMGRNLNGMQYYFDTKRARVGPEFGAVFYRDKDGDHLTAVHVYRMTSWTKVGQELTCGTRSKWRINANGTGVFTARFNYGCLEMKGKNGFVPLSAPGTTRRTKGPSRCVGRCSVTTTSCVLGVRSLPGSEPAGSLLWLVHWLDTDALAMTSDSPFGSPVEPDWG